MTGTSLVCRTRLEIAENRGQRLLAKLVPAEQPLETTVKWRKWNRAFHVTNNVDGHTSGGTVEIYSL